MSQTIWKSLSSQADQLAQRALADIDSLEKWKSELPSRRRELLRSLGLDPWPSRSVPTVREFGDFTGDGFRARKIAYELLPDCWGAATIYYPTASPGGNFPAVLYSCGHSATGSWHFQAHALLWARRGYVCLILDSLEQNDNPGEHHGFNLHWHHHRIALGYASCGGEAFNNIRALDVLAADPLVDPARIGMTGVSGGGAMSFFVAALDDRIRAVSTLCGITSPRDSITNRHLPGHCDCMFPLNVHQRDSSDIAALIAPRAALFGFGRHDRIFHLDESIAIAERARKIWKLHGSEDCWKVVIADCPHGDHPDFDAATQQWFDQHVSGQVHPILSRGEREVAESITSVFEGTPPQPNYLALQPRISRPPGSIRLPKSESDWPAIRCDAADRLQALLPPQPTCALEPDANWKLAATTTSWHRGTIAGIDVFLHLEEPTRFNGTVVLSTATGGQGIQDLRYATAGLMERGDTAAALFEPRLSGWNYPGVQSPSLPAGGGFDFGGMIAKAMTWLGTTPVTMYLQDIVCAIHYIRSLPEHSGSQIMLHGKGETAVASLLAAVLDETIAGVLLEDLPGSFEDRCAVIGILGVMDIPQAVGLLAPRKSVIYRQGDANWAWTTRAYARVGATENHQSASGRQNGFDLLLAETPGNLR